MSYSILIPRVFINTSQSKIKKSFESLNIGIVSHVKFIVKMDKYKNPYKNAYVYFHSWFENDAALNLKNKIEDPTYTAKVVYNDPWYWIVLPNTSGPTLIEQCLEKIVNLEKEIAMIQNNMREDTSDISQKMYLSDLDITLDDSTIFENYHQCSPPSPLHEPSYNMIPYKSDDDFDNMIRDSEERRNKYWMTVNYCGNE